MSYTYKVETPYAPIYFESLEAALYFTSEYLKRKGVVLEIQGGVFGMND